MKKYALLAIVLLMFSPSVYSEIKVDSTCVNESCFSFNYEDLLSPYVILHNNTEIDFLISNELDNMDKFPLFKKSYIKIPCLEGLVFYSNFYFDNNKFISLMTYCGDHVEILKGELK